MPTLLIYCSLFSAQKTSGSFADKAISPHIQKRPELKVLALTYLGRAFALVQRFNVCFWHSADVQAYQDSCFAGGSNFLAS